MAKNVARDEAKKVTKNIAGTGATKAAKNVTRDKAKKATKNIAGTGATKAAKNVTRDEAKKATKNIAGTGATKAARNVARDESEKVTKNIAGTGATKAARNVTRDEEKKETKNIAGAEATNTAKNDAADSVEEGLKLIQSKPEGILQSELWKELGVDSRKCSRIVKKLEESGLIKREDFKKDGIKTYLLRAKRQPVNPGNLLAGDELIPCIGCELECIVEECHPLMDWMYQLAIVHNTEE